MRTVKFSVLFPKKNDQQSPVADEGIRGGSEGDPLGILGGSWANKGDPRFSGPTISRGSAGTDSSLFIILKFRIPIAAGAPPRHPHPHPPSFQSFERWRGLLEFYHGLLF